MFLFLIGVGGDDVLVVDVWNFRSVRLAHDVGRALAICPFVIRRPLVIPKAFPSCWCQCSIDGFHCDSLGKRLKFSRYGRFLGVVWVCSKLIDLSFLEVGF
jgi:hypothetical protein